MKNKRKEKLDERLAHLIEDVIERSEVVIAAKEIAGKLEKMREELAKMEADDIMPLTDTMTTVFGPNVGSQFSKVATEQVRNLVIAIQSSKTALDGEISRLEKGVEGGNMSDMSMDAGAPEAPPGPPGAAPGMNEVPPPGGPAEGPPEAGGAPPEAGLPAPPDAGNAEDDMAGFAGRPRKENAKRRGKMIKEFADEGMGIAPKHPHKSDYFHGNMENLGMFHGGLGRMARNIEQEIDSGKLNGAEREGLSNALSHMASVAADAGHWTDPEAKLNTSLQANHITSHDDPVVAAILKKMRELAHGLALRHSQVMERSIIALRKARDPDAMVLQVFRTKLSEGRDAQLAAIRTARQFCIDIEDVVSVVRESVSPKKVKEAAFKGAAAPFKKKGEKDRDTTEEVAEDAAFKGAAAPFKKKGEKDRDTTEVAEDNVKVDKGGYVGAGTDRKNGTKTAKTTRNKIGVEEEVGSGAPGPGVGAPQQSAPLFPVNQAGPAVANGQAPNPANPAATAASNSLAPPAQPTTAGVTTQGTSRQPMTPAQKKTAVVQQSATDAAAAVNTGANATPANTQQVQTGQGTFQPTTGAAPRRKTMAGMDQNVR